MLESSKAPITFFVVDQVNKRPEPNYAGNYLFHQIALLAYLF